MFREPPHFWYSQEDLDSLGMSGNDLKGGHDPRPASGAMAPFLGRRYRAEEIALALCNATDNLDDPDPARVLPVRAFEVPPLLGAIFRGDGEEGLGDGLLRLLDERLPGIAWRPCPISIGALRKYLFVHLHVPAPPDETTGEPMGLEVCGDLISVSGIRIRTAEGEAWHRERREREDRQSRTQGTPGLLPVEGRLEIEITSATYANISNPGIGVPFYM